MPKQAKPRKPRNPNLFYIVGRQCDRAPIEVIDGPIPHSRSEAEGIAALVRMQGNWNEVQVVPAGRAARLFGGPDALVDAAAQVDGGYFAKVRRGMRDYDWR